MLIGVVLVTAACSGDDLTNPPTGEPPRIATATVSINPNNSLSTLVAFTAEHADSARVVYWVEGSPKDSTPYQAVIDGNGTVATLGLRSATAYRQVLQLSSGAGTASSDTLEITSGDLPAPLQQIKVLATGTGGPGLTLSAMPVGGTAVWAFAFDSAGTIRWYRRFEDPRIGGELKQQRNGNFTMYIGASFGSQPVPGYYVEFTPAGDSVRTFAAPGPTYTDNHELWITGKGETERIHLFGYDIRNTDLTSVGGTTNTNLAGHQLVRLRPDGSTEFSWNSWDHLALADWIEPPRPGPVDPAQPDFDHPNSIEFDRDSNYIVSFRNMGEVMKIDATTGATIWRLGGANNQFTFVDDPFGGFSAQHSPRMLPNGNLLLYDNGTRHQPSESRAVEYALDLDAKTATLVWEYRHDPPIYTPFVGAVQRLASGNTLVAFAQAGRAVEATPTRTTAWEADLRLDGKPAFVYRMVRIASLYRYETP
jgi:outer membrane protein assembly factor BamB